MGLKGVAMNNRFRIGFGSAVVALAVVGSACGASEPENGGAPNLPVEATTTLTERALEPSTTTLSADTDELVTILEHAIAGTQLPALGVSVFDGNEIIETAATGVRRSGDPTPVELSDLFHIGSNTKAITATLVAVYVDDGEITWETTLSDVFGDLIPEIHPDYAGVTIRQLLNHTAGIDDDLAFEPLLEHADTEKDVVEQRFDVAAITLTRPAHHPQGEFMYSNIGYTLVGAMLEELTGVSWEDLVRSKIFDPLGMNSCGFYAPGTPGTVDQPWGHFTELGNKPMDPGDTDAEYPHVLSPAGMIHCSMGDWAVFLQSQLRGVQGSDTEIVSREAFEALRATPAGSDYALGWVSLPDTPLGMILTHDGSNDRFMSEALLAPDSDWGVLVVTNIGESVAAPTVSAVMDAMVERHVGSR
jgi:D-alanyl-D-alanine carboxypeptidase